VKVNSLGYVGVQSEDPQRWAGFAANILGMQPLDGEGGSVQLRMDGRHHRVSVEKGPAEGGAYYGWEVDDAVALDRAASELDVAGVAVQNGNAQEIEGRRVAGMIHFTDPAGHRVEIFCGQADGDGQFTPTRDISGFVTGDLGMGHIVLLVPELAPAQRFYQDVMGFKLSDYMNVPFRAAFMHTNPRHHSLALLEVGATALHHFMVECNDMDDVGRGFDVVQKQGVPVAATLGRHSNDDMFSFYMMTPSGFQTEYGWGGRLVDEDWKPFELTAGPSIWGHAGLG
jgi:extradiol dioxygenase